MRLFDFSIKGNGIMAAIENDASWGHLMALYLSANKYGDVWASNAKSKEDGDQGGALNEWLGRSYNSVDKWRRWLQRHGMIRRRTKGEIKGLYSEQALADDPALRRPSAQAAVYTLTGKWHHCDGTNPDRDGKACACQSFNTPKSGGYFLNIYEIPQNLGDSNPQKLGEEEPQNLGDEEIPSNTNPIEDSFPAEGGAGATKSERDAVWDLLSGLIKSPAPSWSQAIGKCIKDFESSGYDLILYQNLIQGVTNEMPPLTKTEDLYKVKAALISLMKIDKTGGAVDIYKSTLKAFGASGPMTAISFWYEVVYATHFALDRGLPLPAMIEALRVGCNLSRMTPKQYKDLWTNARELTLAEWDATQVKDFIASLSERWIPQMITPSAIARNIKPAPPQAHGTNRAGNVSQPDLDPETFERLSKQFKALQKGSSHG